MKHWIGTSGFQYAEWKGGFYPGKMSLPKMLAYYSERFPSTEVNYTFRSMPSAKTIARWIDETPQDFRFTCKAPQKITHFAKLKNCGDTVAHFHGIMKGLGKKRGAVLFQLPPTIEKDNALLDDFLKTLPKDMRAAFEFRHESWFDEGIYDLLRKHNAALCLAESDELLTPRIATADFGYLRLRKKDYPAAELNSWADFLREQNENWQETFIYFKHENTGTGPVFAAQMQEILR